MSRNVGQGRRNRGAGAEEPLPGDALRGGQSGAVLVLVLLALPAFVLLLGLVVDVGLLYLARVQLRAALDMGALAGAQELDLDALARGELRLVEEAARREATALTRRNLVAAFGAEVLDRAVIRVVVYQAGPTAPLVHQVTGRSLVDPTVGVVAEVPVRLAVLGRLLPEVTLRAHADASVVGRE